MSLMHQTEGVVHRLIRKEKDIQHLLAELHRTDNVDIHREVRLRSSVRGVFITIH